MQFICYFYNVFTNFLGVYDDGTSFLAEIDFWFGFFEQQNVTFASKKKFFNNMFFIKSQKTFVTDYRYV